ncbi:5-formyltetrahydrofolate cyclo-ligase [Stakelama tenebrarum]|uniref:5-formyltetrahydrofolate cyclo-ligase n=1 Tax=Stakelama tenebrarum TaxID=2711215 RepID=A0A6G6Y7I2_9SPHN|nr:5-formyltetrahydrofolate cyclo-ligase [Sphingosinithalassobacter tenebrarum]QIG80533.1 5-formyltetrahydrofolate cyclo-ligase [Sphingosinithalassobacter tenebrarum]
MKSLAEEKQALRREIRSLRRGFVMAGGLPDIALPALLERRIAKGTVIAAYLPMRFEADPGPLAQRARELGARIALPYIETPAVPMRFLEWTPGDETEVNNHAIRQPLRHAEELVPDIILTPLLAFDDALHRLGQGRGYYDRAFAHFGNALRVGVAWSIQEVPAVPVESWDEPLDAVVTERGLFSKAAL